MENINELKYFLDNFETAPVFNEMPRRTLYDKGAAGPTGAHVIEEVHVPLNLAYISVTTGSTAFQNITGVTHSELGLRIAAGRKALELAGICKGDKLLVTYPPLINVFCKDALESSGVEWSFLERSCRNALLWALCARTDVRSHTEECSRTDKFARTFVREERPRAIIGESSFLRAALEDAEKLGLISELPENTIYLAAGTPLDLELPEIVSRHNLGEVHDLYGCQEYGWLTLDGCELRGDISLIPSGEKEGYYHLITGGLPTGDCFSIAENGHLCRPSDAARVPQYGDIITYSRLRTRVEPEAIITHTTANSEDTIYRLVKTILRIKGKILRVSPELVTGAEVTRIVYKLPLGGNAEIIGPDKTALIDALLDAQMKYQSQDKKDPAWIKER